MYTFIVNPNARTGLGVQVWERLERILSEKNVKYKAYLTRYPNHAAEFAAEATAGEEDITLIALGGDGTINEVINGIRDFSKVTFGYIPIGSSNDFARSMGLSRNPEQMLSQISTYVKLDGFSIWESICSGVSESPKDLAKSLLEPMGI